MGFIFSVVTFQKISFLILSSLWKKKIILNHKSYWKKCPVLWFLLSISCTVKILLGKGLWNEIVNLSFFRFYSCKNYWINFSPKSTASWCQNWINILTTVTFHLTDRLMRATWAKTASPTWLAASMRSGRCSSSNDIKKGEL